MKFSSRIGNNFADKHSTYLIFIAISVAVPFIANADKGLNRGVKRNHHVRKDFG